MTGLQIRYGDSKLALNILLNVFRTIGSNVAKLFLNRVGKKCCCCLTMTKFLITKTIVRFSYCSDLKSAFFSVANLCCMHSPWATLTRTLDYIINSIGLSCRIFEIFACRESLASFFELLFIVQYGANENRVLIMVLILH